MKWKGLFVIVLLVIPFAVFAGGQGEEEERPAEVTLEFPSWQAEEPGFAQFWEYAIEEFEAKHPDVTVALNQIPFAQFRNSMITRLAAGNPPDVSHWPARNIPELAAEGWFEPLDDRLAETDIPETWTPLQESMVHNGETVGVLLMGYGYLLFYNEALLEDAGVSVPTTLDELLEAARAVTDRDEGIHGFAMVTQEHPNVYVDAAKFVIGEGERFMADGEYRFTEPAVVELIEKYRELGQLSPQGASSAFARQLLIDGRVAMLIDGPWVAATLEQADAEIRPHLKTARVPTTQVTGGPSNSVHIARDIPDYRKDIVWEFIRELTTPEAQKQYTMLTRSPAAREGVLSEAELANDPQLALINESAAQAVNTWPQSDNVNVNYSRFSDIVAAAMLQLIQDPSADTLSVLEALEERLYSEIEP